MCSCSSIFDNDNKSLIKFSILSDWDIITGNKSFISELIFNSELLSNVSRPILIDCNGVLSSWETFATKSDFNCWNLWNSVKSLINSTHDCSSKKILLWSRYAVIFNLWVAWFLTSISKSVTFVPWKALSIEFKRSGLRKNPLIFSFNFIWKSLFEELLLKIIFLLLSKINTASGI